MRKLARVSGATERRRDEIAALLSRDVVPAAFVASLCKVLGCVDSTASAMPVGHVMDALKRNAVAAIECCRSIYWLEAVGTASAAEAMVAVGNAESDVEVAAELRKVAAQYLAALEIYLEAKAAGPALGPP